jgi:hypothetical protein
MSVLATAVFVERTRWYSIVLRPWLGLQLYVFLSIKLKAEHRFLNGLGAHA